MADRQWFAEGVQVFETGEEEFFAEGWQINEDEAASGEVSIVPLDEGMLRGGFQGMTGGLA